MSTTTMEQDDSIRASHLKAWAPLIITIITLGGGGFASYLRLRFELEAVTARLAAIETRGTDHARSALARVESLESGAAETRRIVTDQGVTLERIDRRLGLLLCRTDRRYCDVER